MPLPGSEKPTRVNVLFVCLGNICRSPTAHGVFESRIQSMGLMGQIGVDSAGTGDWHIGRPPHKTTLTAARQRGYELEHLRARQVCHEDFEHFDYMLAMDLSNLSNLQGMAPPGSKCRVELFLDYHHDTNLVELPDPYGGGPAGFDRVLDMVEVAADGLLNAIRERHGLSTQSSLMKSQLD